MTFESFTEKAKSIREHEKTKLNLPKKMIQERFQIKNIEMVMVGVIKAQYATLNDERFYFSVGIIPFLYGNCLLYVLRMEK